MPALFDNLTLETARQLLGIDSLSLISDGPSLTKPEEAEAIKSNQAFVNKSDYYQDGKQGVFPGLLEDETEQTKTTVSREFATMPGLEGIVRRKKRGVAGREPGWEYTLRRALKDDENPTTEEQQLMDESGAAVTNFWESRALHGLTQDTVTQFEVTGEIPVRIFVRGAAAGEIKRQSTLADAVDLIYCELLGPGEVYRYVDRQTMQELLGYKYKENYLAENKEVSCRDRLVITYLDGQRMTVVRSWTDDKEDPKTDALDLNGNLLIKFIKAPPFLTLAMRQVQNQISKSVTMMGHNNNLAGFMMLVAKGLLPPGEWKEIEGEGGVKDYVYVQDEEMDIGPNKLTFLQTQMVYDKESKGWKFPPSSGLDRIDPIDPEFLIKSAEYLYLCLLRAADQEHTLITGDAIASAVSRVESRAQFVWSLLETKVKIEELLRWLLETVLLLAVNLMAERTVATEGAATVRRLSDGGKSHIERFKALRARVDVYASAGPLSPEEKRVVAEIYKAGLMDRATAIIMLGTEDVDAEIANLDKDPARSIDLDIKRAQLFSEWSAVMDAPAAAMLAGLTDEQTAIVLKKEVAPNGGLKEA